MDAKEYDEQTAIERLRMLVARFNNNTEAVNERFTVEQLLAIDRAWCLSAWDIYPDQWTERQLREAIRGRVPTWDDNEKPTYDPPEKRGWASAVFPEDVRKGFTLKD